VPNEIINKKGKLTDEEFGVIQVHTNQGYEILAEIKSRPDLAYGAEYHHEHYDGTGYPEHKKGEEIPLEARIIAVADSYDAMTSNRSYRNLLPQEKVRSEILNNIGTQFDEKPAKCMIEIMDEDKEYQLHE
ncbi:MAG: HD domain-containing protein, partial [Lachnospiraceae bacterium]|nr:HD domain-containing protein [Lachnospiraceae bacterium]